MPECTTDQPGPPEPKPQPDVAPELLQWELDKTQSSHFETGKKLGAALGLFVVIASTLVIITFSDTSREKISIPFLEIEVSKWYGVELLTILCAGCFYRFIALMEYHKVAGRELSILLIKRGHQHFPQYIGYPSLLPFFELMISRSRAAKLCVCLILVSLVFAGMFLPTICAITTLANQGFTFHWLASSIITASFLAATYVIARTGLDLRHRYAHNNNPDRE